MAVVQNTMEGDLTLGRHITTGGGVTARGDSVFWKDVEVKGWLRAKNIIGACRGLYATVEQLLAKNPRPVDGQWALVGWSKRDDGVLEFPLWTVVDGEWTDSGERVTSEQLVVDFGITIEDFTTLMDLVGQVLSLLSPKMEISDSLGGFLATGETDVVRCKIIKGYVDITSEVDTWTITRYGGVSADDEVWNASEKAQNFTGTIELTLDDLGSANSTVFTVTASWDSDTVTGEIMI